MDRMVALTLCLGGGIDGDDEVVFDINILSWGDVPTTSRAVESSKKTRTTSAKRVDYLTFTCSYGL